uniref:right-handed parallel beta-helix repeat-containing protein n=1 Tax=Flavonifractor sp. AGMB03687 TaxID=2785133 RepID=UPI001FD86201
MKKKLLSLLMALCLVVTLLPVSALAADDSADAAADLIEGSAEESAESLMEVPAATASETVVKGNNSGSNQPVNSESIFNGTTAIAEVGGQQYSTLQEALNAAASSENKTITILVSGEYVPFTVNQVGVNVCAKDGVDVTIKTNKTTKMAVTANNVTLKGLNFVSTDGTAVISGGSCDGLTLEKCSFTGNGATDSIALYIHQPNITITGCTFENFERGYYTCGDNHAAGNMVFEGNTFTNVRVPIDGYWGMPATNNTNIQVTDNKIDAGSWGTAYIQLWDYAQLAKWADFVHQGEKLNPDGKTALKGMVSGNSATGGELVLYATHCNWYSNSEIQWKGQQPVYRNMIFLENVTKENEVTVTHKDGSPITAFNESTGKKEVAKKYVIYTLSEGEYKVNVTQKQENGDSVVTEYDLTVVPTEHDPTGGNTQKIKVTPLDGENNTVAVVGNVPYTSLAAAVEAAKNGGTVELLQNVTIDTWNQVWDTDGLTIKGNNHTVTVNNVESGANGNYLFYGAKNLNVSDLTIKFTTNGSGFSMVSGKLEGVTVNGGVYAVATGAAPAGQK